MPNPNYKKGRRKEYQIIKELKNNGFDIAHRTAGSHSPIDVFGIHRGQKLIVFIQSKFDNYPQAQLKLLMEKYKWLNGEFTVKFDVI